MYRTVNEYLTRVQDAHRACRHDVNNVRTRRHLTQYRHLERWSDLRDEVLTPDLEYLIDVLSRADFVVARVGDIFEPDVARRVLDEAAAQEGVVCVVTQHGGFDPGPALRDEAFTRLRDLCRDKVLDVLVAETRTDERRSSVLRAAYRKVTGADLSPTSDEFERVARLLPIKRDLSREDAETAVRRRQEGVARRERDERGNDET